MTATTAAAASGVFFAPPKPDRTVPAVAEWTYHAHDPFGVGGGPVLMRWRPEALARLNRDAEALLARAGVTPRVRARARLIVIVGAPSAIVGERGPLPAPFTCRR